MSLLQSQRNQQIHQRSRILNSSSSNGPTQQIILQPVRLRQEPAQHRSVGFGNRRPIIIWKDSATNNAHFPLLTSRPMLRNVSRSPMILHSVPSFTTKMPSISSTHPLRIVASWIVPLKRVKPSHHKLPNSIQFLTTVLPIQIQKRLSSRKIIQLQQLTFVHKSSTSPIPKSSLPFTLSTVVLNDQPSATSFKPMLTSSNFITIKNFTTTTPTFIVKTVPKLKETKLVKVNSDSELAKNENSTEGNFNSSLISSNNLGDNKLHAKNAKENNMTFSRSDEIAEGSESLNESSSLAPLIFGTESPKDLRNFGSSPGFLPPSDAVVKQLNDASDFLTIAKAMNLRETIKGAIS
ncbi:unnamed protein product [Thelazia callipaeda]|uniref:Uncharacterized protein n=1 Tax=Thelazia callipaeda TaxID=103827 RepID=A0A0N5D360_THECL|nr:unnamed protein product [Thelazia callipaeda]